MIVSVVIPVFNYARFLSRAIDSVLNQSYGNFEIIVVDDGSTDNTPLVASMYGDLIRYVPKKNGGVSSARNVGILQAKGQYIAFLDADDEWEELKISCQIDFMEKNYNYIMSYTDMSYVENGRLVHESFLHERSYKCLSSGWLFASLLQESFILPSTVIIRRECFDQVGYFNESLTHAEDQELWLRVSRKFQIGFLDMPLTIRHEHGEGATSSRTKFHLGQINMLDVILATGLNRDMQILALRQRALACWHHGYQLFLVGDMKGCRKFMFRYVADGGSIRSIVRYVVASVLPFSFVNQLRKFWNFLKLMCNIEV